MDGTDGTDDKHVATLSHKTRRVAAWSRRAIKRWVVRLSRAIGERALTGPGIHIGENPIIEGSPYVECLGEIEIGDRFTLHSRPVQSQLMAARGAQIKIGADVCIGFGAVFGAKRSIVVGNRVRAGAYVTVVDADGADWARVALDEAFDDPSPAAVVIEDDVVIGNGVSILKGARIGHGAQILAHSVVIDDVPAQAVASGNPARPIVAPSAHPKRSIPYPALATKSTGVVSLDLQRVCETRPDATAILCDDRRVTYAMLSNRIAALTSALAGAKLGRRERCVFQVEDKCEYLASFYAIISLGAIAVPMGAAAAPKSVVEVANECSATIILTDRAHEERLRACDDTTPPMLVVETIDDGVPRAWSPRKMASSAPALIMFTSGTTSKRKAVLLTHKNLTQATTNINEFMGIPDGIREYVAIPLSHSFGFGRARCVFARGGTLVLQNGFFNPPAMVDAIIKNRCQGLSAVPATLALFGQNLQSQLAEAAKHVYFVELGSAFMSVSQKARLVELFPNARVCMHYGLTEASRSTFLEFGTERDKLDTVGRASPNVKVQICNPDGKILGPNEPGEIVIGGGHVTAGYWGNDDLNQRVFLPKGYFRTGDFGTIDAAGYVRLLGRKDEMINMGGIKISPLEVEQAIRRVYPDADICVLGLPDPAGVVGDIPVVAYARASAVDMTLGVLTTALADSLDRTKLPHQVVAVDRLPKTENGKVIRSELRKMILGDGALVGSDQATHVRT